MWTSTQRTYDRMITEENRSLLTKSNRSGNGAKFTHTHTHAWRSRASSHECGLNYWKKNNNKNKKRNRNSTCLASVEHTTVHYSWASKRLKQQQQQQQCRCCISLRCDICIQTSISNASERERKHAYTMYGRRTKALRNTSVVRLASEFQLQSIYMYIV